MNLTIEWEFSMHLSPYTPRAVLEQHGATRSTQPPEKMTEHGHWIQVVRTKSFAEFGLLLEVAGVQDRPFGPSQDKDALMLEYLKEVRRIAESGHDRAEKANFINAIRGKRKYDGIRNELDGDRGFELAYQDLIAVPGVGPAIAYELVDRGVESPHDLRSLSDRQLLDIPGIRKARLKEIRAAETRETPREQG